MNIIEYSNPEFRLRSVSIEGEPWFVAKDVCAILGISKYRDAVAQLDEDERMSMKMDTLGGEQEMAAINESGLYALIFRSRKPSARIFRRWVTGEVLPAIRRDGIYRMRSLDGQRIKELEAAVVGARQTLHKKVDAFWRAQAIAGQYPIRVYLEAAGLCDANLDPLRLYSALRELRADFEFPTGYCRVRKTAGVGMRRTRQSGSQRVRTWPPDMLATALKAIGCQFQEPDAAALATAEEKLIYCADVARRRSLPPPLPGVRPAQLPLGLLQETR